MQCIKSRNSNVKIHEFVYFKFLYIGQMNPIFITCLNYNIWECLLVLMLTYKWRQSWSVLMWNVLVMPYNLSKLYTFCFGNILKNFDCLFMWEIYSIIFQWSLVWFEISIYNYSDMDIVPICIFFFFFARKNQWTQNELLLN